MAVPSIFAVGGCLVKPGLLGFRALILIAGIQSPNPHAGIQSPDPHAGIQSPDPHAQTGLRIIHKAQPTANTKLNTRDPTMIRLRAGPNA